MEGKIKKPQSAKKPKNTFLERLHFLASKTWINLDIMDKNKWMKITDAQMAESKYGNRLLVEIDKQQRLYLPERFSAATPEDIEELASGKYEIMNCGKDGRSYDLKFRETSATSSSGKRSATIIPVSDNEDDETSSLPMEREEEYPGIINSTPDFYQNSQRF